MHTHLKIQSNLSMWPPLLISHLYLKVTFFLSRHIKKIHINWSSFKDHFFFVPNVTSYIIQVRLYCFLSCCLKGDLLIQVRLGCFLSRCLKGDLLIQVRLDCFLSRNCNSVGWKMFDFIIFSTPTLKGSGHPGKIVWLGPLRKVHNIS